MQTTIDFSAAARDVGMEKSADHAGTEWIDKALVLMKKYTGACDEGLFICEQFRDYCTDCDLEAPPHLRAYGTVMKKAEKLGLIRNTGRFTQVNNVKAHKANCSVWQKI